MAHPVDHAALDAAYAQARTRFLHLPHVTGVDIGFTYHNRQRTPRMSVRIHVVKKKPLSSLLAHEVFPQTLCGCPVDVLEARYLPCAGAGITRHDVLRPGISISHLNGQTGTLGAIVFHEGRPCILSAAHVLLLNHHSLAGEPVVQPGRIHGGGGADTVADLKGHALVNGLDAAFAKLNGSRPFDRAQRRSGVVLKAARAPGAEDMLDMVGAVSDKQTARYDGAGAYTLDLGGRSYDIEGFRLVPLAGAPAGTEISRAGDSGAVWYDPGTDEGVGLHVAGDPDDNQASEVALACALPDVLNVLNLTLTPDAFV